MLRDPDCDRDRLPGIGADGRHTGKCRNQRNRHSRYPDFPVACVPDNLCHPDGGSSNCEHDDGWIGDRVRRGCLIQRWDRDLGRGVGQQIEHVRRHRVDIVLSRWFRRVFRERNDSTLEQRSGLGSVSAVRSLGNAALPNRDRSFLRAVMEAGWDRRGFAL